MKRKAFLSFLLVLFVSQTYAYKVQEDFKIKVNGQERSMILYTPDAMTRDMPLMIITHGMNQDPNYQRNSDKFYEMCDTARFVLCYLKSDGNTWDIGGQKDLNFVKETITQMNKIYGIDKKRVYWGGFSMGSMLIFHGLNNGMQNYIAAFSPCSGILHGNATPPSKAVNLIFCIYKGDQVFKWDDYHPRDYVAHFADGNRYADYKKWSSATLTGTSGSNATGEKERWWNGANGAELEIFCANGGDHFPSNAFVKEIWGFLKRFTLDTKLASYKKVRDNAKQMLIEWEGERSTNFNISAVTYNNFQKKVELYASEKPDTLTDEEMEKFKKELEAAIKTFTTACANKIKTSKKVTKTTFDPNFHIYLCFGQSNSEGNATPMLEDYANATKRFLMMAPVNMTTYGRYKNSWYVARPPLCRDYTGLTPGDSFGKYMVANTPDSITIGVINVSLGGCSIDMFKEEGIADYIKQQASWLQNYAKSYNNNPFRYLVDAAKKAQKVGVIKGILLHQGCSDNGSPTWPDRVKDTYERLLHELDLSGDTVPLFVGELMQQNQGGICWGHNSVIAKVPNVIKNSYVVSSEGCTGTVDGLHFTAAGYRKLGENYAKTVLKSQERYSQNNNYTIKTFVPGSKRVQIGLGQNKAIYMYLTDNKNVKHDVTGACKYIIDNPEVVSIHGVNAIAANAEGLTNVTAVFTNAEGEEATAEFEICVRTFPLDNKDFNPSILKTGTLTTASTNVQFKSQKDGMGGWVKPEGIDLSAFNYLTVNMPSASLAKPTVRIYDVNDAGSDSYYELKLVSGLNIIDLNNMTTAANAKVDPKHICIVGITSTSTSAIKLADVFLSVDDPTGMSHIRTEQSTDNAWYDLSGRRTTFPTKKGIYMRNGKKFIVR